MANVGWIGLHRKITEHWLFPQFRIFSEFEAWLYLLLQANFSDSKLKDGNVIFTIKRGEILTSEKKLGIVWLWDRNKVRRFLNILQKDGMIFKKSSTKFTIITICKYDNYQDFRTTDEQRMNNKRTTDEQRMNTSEEGKEGKEGKEGEEGLDTCIDIALRDERWIRLNSTSVTELQVFKTKLEKESINYKTPIDFKTHFARWKKKQPPELVAQKEYISKAPNDNKW